MCLAKVEGVETSSYPVEQYKLQRRSITSGIHYNSTQLKLSSQYTDAIALEEKDLLIQLEKWSNIKESFQKKSRSMWIKLGDSNTKYFAAIMKERHHKKQIIKLTSANGEKICGSG